MSRTDHHVADHPGVIINNKILHLSDVAIPRVNRVADHGARAMQMRSIFRFVRRRDGLSRSQFWRRGGNGGAPVGRPAVVFVVIRFPARLLIFFLTYLRVYPHNGCHNVMLREAKRLSSA